MCCQHHNGGAAGTAPQCTFNRIGATIRWQQSVPSINRQTLPIYACSLIYAVRFCFLNFAHLAFCASDIRLRAAAESLRVLRPERLALPGVKPCNAFAAASKRRNSLCASARLASIVARIWARFTLVCPFFCLV